jgi:hypothetical protein
LKKNYTKYCKEMSDTGQGLLDADCEDEILAGSDIANIWGTQDIDIGGDG